LITLRFVLQVAKLGKAKRRKKNNSNGNKAEHKSSFTHAHLPKIIPVLALLEEVIYDN